MKYLLLLLLSLFSTLSFGQIKVWGKTTDIYENGIANVNIIIKKTQTNKILQFSSSGNDGNYSVNCQSASDSITITFSFLGYETQSFTINSSGELNVLLISKEVTLKEISIEGIQRIRISGDTVEYSTKAFSDGTEKAIEDVIRKLPGIDVSEEGKIRFKGKEIDKILLDGTDMFSADYRLASKNVPAKFIDKIQAIENYHENSMLKNAEKSDKIILNLSLDEKNVKSDIFGELSLSGGYENKYELASNLFSITKKIKIYNTTNFNNSERHSAFSSKENIENLYTDYNFTFVNSGLVEHDFIPNINTNEINVGKTKREFNSFNIAYRPDSKLELQGNILFNKNKDSFDTFQKTIYSNILSIEEHSNLNQQPQTILGSLKLGYQIKENLKLDYQGVFDKDVKKDQNNLFTSSFFNEKTKGKHLFINNKLNFTLAMKDSAAFLFNVALLTNKNNQDFAYSSDNINLIDQRIKAGNVLYKMAVNYYKKNNDRFFYTLAVEYSWKKQQIFTKPDLIDEFNVFGSTTSDILFRSNLYYAYSKSKFRAEIQFGYKKQELLKNNNILYNKKDFVVAPHIQYSLDLKPHLISLSASYSQRPIDLNNHIQDSIHTSYRSLYIGTDEYVTGGNISMGFLYSCFDIFKQTTFVIGGNRILSMNVFANNLLITPQANYSSLIPNSNRTTDILFANLKKYFDPLRFTMNIDNSLSYMKYYNAINSDFQKKNKTYSYYARLSIKSALDIPINYTVGSVFRYSCFKAEKTNSHMSNYSFFQDILIKVGNFKTRISFDECFLGKNEKFYFFISPSFEYCLPESNVSFKIDAYNILNHKKIYDYSVDDYSATEIHYRIMPSQVLLSFNLRF